MEGGSLVTSAEGISLQELQLAARNHGMPLEALRYDVTPVGLHYVLVHYDIPAVDTAAWRLHVEGLVDRPLVLDLDAIKSRPFVTARVTMECAGNGRALTHPRAISQPWLQEAIGTGEWGGTALRPILEEAGLGADAVDVVFTGLDRGIEGEVEQRYARSLPPAEALRDDVLLAYELNGGPLPPQHGYPVRLVVPGWYGMASVKWLERITVLPQPFDGFQNRQSYRLRQEEDEAGEPLSRMAPRALMIPPGIPEFLTRERTIDAGPCRLAGRAWSGHGGIASVEVSADGGTTWDEAELGEQADPSAWAAWSYVWDAPGPGRYELACRARDVAGNEQPLEPPWNLGSYANNAVQRVAVIARAV